jgi:hypothetical protein
MLAKINGEIIEFFCEEVIDEGDIIVLPNQDILVVTQIVATLPCEATAVKLNLHVNKIPPEIRAKGVYHSLA